MENDSFISLCKLSQRLGLPAAWLKAEAAAGRIPTLRTGRRLMFNAEAVRCELLKRAAQHGGEVRP